MQWGFVLLAYLLGCIPFGLLTAKACNVDLRASGSGNIGATNVLRVAGKKAGVATLIGDMLKGTLAVYLALRFAGRETACLAAVAAVAGHDFPVFLRFKGGKGVATSFGVLLALEPVIALIGFGVWLATVLAWNYSSLGALVSFSLLPVWALLLKSGDRSFLLLSLFLTTMLVIKHRANIVRLSKGEEPRVGRKTQEGKIKNKI